MAQIPNKLLYFSQGSSYRTKREDEEIRDDSIVFVEDDASIATRGKVFGVRGVYPGQEEENLTDEGNTSIKVITTNPLFPLDDNGRPLVGTTISVRFKYTNSYKTSGTPMQLNVNGIGPYNICYQGTDYVSTTSANTTFCGYAEREILYTFRVDINPDTGAEMPHWVFISHGYESGNTNTIGYQLRHNSSTLPASDKFYCYRLLFTSADGSKYVPADTSSSTNATASRTVNQRPIDPFGEILYYSSTSSVAAGSNPEATVIWSEYTFNLGYSFNRTGTALTMSYPAPVYIKCTPQSDGSAIIDSSTPYVQSLPSTNDGKIYIFLGIAYSATSIELMPIHPVYYYDGTGIRIWTGSTDLSNYYTKTEVDTALSGKQAALVSGTNLKTINNESLLGSGNLTASDVGAIPTVISTTYNDLVTAVTNSQLIEGAWYRITDYVCTTAQTDTQSAEHQFDILVQAVSPNKLSEEARATRHEGDTYFANSNLEAWKIWYCLDNDVTRFAWAEPAEGKGVIYRMIDEWGNDCPYDFKNIQFKRYQLKNRNYLYASKALWDNDGDTYGNEAITNFHNIFAIIYNNLGTSINSNTIPFYYTRGIHDEYYIVDESEIYGYDEIYETYRDNSGNTIALSESGTRKFVAVYNLLNDYYDIILEVNDTDGEWMYTFSRKNGINTPSIDNSLSGKIYNNKFTNSGTLYDNVFISYNIDLIVQNNTFGNDCESNTFGNYCTLNTFGIDCDLNTFGNSCYNNSFGNNCDSNTFGIDCKLNTFGNSCCNNFLGNNVYRNTLGNYVYSNTFGHSCNNNSFGNNVHRNTFGNGCDSNTFGNDCDSNIFGKGCDSNTFGNDVDHVTFSKDYTRYVIVENGNRYITLTSTETTSSSNLLRNITIAQGVNNTSTTKIISHNTLKDTFRTTYTTNVNGIIYAIAPTKYSEWDNKQSTLISGTNLKTINNESLLGSGNISIQGGGSSANIEYNSSKTALVIGGGSTKYTISLDDGDVILPSVKINDFTYSSSRFPLEVNSGDILNVVVSMPPGSCTTTMGGTTVSTSKSFSIQSVSGNIEIKVTGPGSGPGGYGPGIVH